MKSLLLILLFLYATTASFSQAPGYMGKRLSFYYTPAFFISLQPDPATSYFSSGGRGLSPGINLRHDFAMDYVVSKGVALGCSFKYLTSKLPGAFFYTDKQYPLPEDAFLGDVKLRGPAFSVYVKNFNYGKRGSIAPVGYYTKWEIMYGRVSGKTGDLTASNQAPEGYNYVKKFEDLGFEKSQSLFGILFSFGRQSLLFDRLFINTGGSVGFVPGGMYFSVGNSYYGTEANYIEAVHYRMMGYFLLNFNLGIGVLAF
jgi:hypothetical protein